MKLYYFNDPHGNFGDDLNPWLWQQLFGDIFDQNADDLFVGVGTLLNHRIPAATKVTVFGSGHGYGEKPQITPNWTFYCVRGPLTAQSLGLDASLGITDPAALVPQFYQSVVDKKYKVSFMPHCESARYGDWQQACDMAGIHFLDPRKPFLEVFNGIKQTEVLLTEAMHGAILADAFRVPWVPVKAYSHISEYKWQDWLQSVQLSAEFNHLPSLWRGDELFPLKTRLKHKVKRLLAGTPVWQAGWQAAPPAKSTPQQLQLLVQQLTKLASSARPLLSLDSVFADNCDKLQHKVQQFKQDKGC